MTAENNKRANHRYFSVLVPSMLVFLASSFVISGLADTLALPNSLIYALATLPVAALLATFSTLVPVYI